ncbi:hypothetical protein EDB83DRAFT_2311186 [Lactarius deliciosus]|nr:hypothetical protein EDB83DRAFT_2311186 [Lactarius deliciosus]
MSLSAFHFQVIMAPIPSLLLFTRSIHPEVSRGIECFGDVDKFYDNGYGSNLGRVQGVGSVNELPARLTGKPVRDITRRNRTLGASPEAFPLDCTLFPSGQTRTIRFSRRMAVEKLKCTREIAVTFFRIPVNEVLEGLCELHAFMENHWYAKHDGGEVL